MNTQVIKGTGFWGSMLEKIRTQMIPFQLRALKDEVEGAAPSHAIENFEIAAGLKTGTFYGCVFQDSDVGKWIEAASYSLMLKPDKALESEIDRIIDIVGKAQQPDGYLNTYFTVKEPENRWKNLCECHEMYCAGHMIEGAVAYYEATGKDSFLNIMCRMADCIYSVFGPDGTAGYPGHPELELALYRLYGATGNEKYKQLANLFLDRRGTSPNYFDIEKAARAGKVYHEFLKEDEHEYAQAHKPLREQTEAVGHAVRALYLYSGAADEALAANDKSMISAMDALWDNVTKKQMYVTGGFGATAHGEAFNGNYELPNDTVYAETCASVAFVFWASRMLKLHLRSGIADEMERALYNTVLAGSNLACDKYFYVNPLEVIPGISGKKNDFKHVLPQRPSWFGCACCPPNMARLLLSLNRYAYTFADDTLQIHLYLDGTVSFPGVSVTHTGNYPWDGALHFDISCEKPLTVMLRVPRWSKSTVLAVDGKPVDVKAASVCGYVKLPLCAGKHTVDMTLDMSVRRIYANPAVREDTGCVALMRGPVVYCVESVEQEAPLCTLRLPKNAPVTVEAVKDGILSGVCVLKAEALRAQTQDALYTESPAAATPCTITAIPYYTWGNRGEHEMRVWLPEV